MSEHGWLKRMVIRIWKWKWRLSGSGLALMLLGYVTFYGVVSCSSSNTRHRMYLSNGDVLAFEDTAQAPSREWVPEPDRNERMASAQPVILIHGTPTDASSWNTLIKSAQAQRWGNGGQFRLIAVDRLGFGNSSSGEVLELEVHAAAIIEMIEKLDQKPVIVGHSYGGPVALKIATMIPEMIQGTVIVAGACDPYMQDSIWFRELVDGAGVLVPDSYSKGNAELLALTEENRKMEADLHKVTSPVVVMHGTWDPVCPYESTTSYLEKSLVNTEVTILPFKRAGHNLHLSQPDKILEAIQSMK